MAAKWIAQQRRKNWTDGAVSLPSSAQQPLQGLKESEHVEVSSFGVCMQEFVQFPTTFAQKAAVKRLSDRLLALARRSEVEEDLKRGLCLYVELLFGENSRPLHKSLLTVFLHHFPSEKAEYVQEAFLLGCKEYGAGGVKERRFALTGLATSLANLPRKSNLVHCVTKCCARLIVPSLCHDVGCVLAHAKQGGRPTPKTMEDCQDCMSALYYFLQKFPECFGGGCSFGSEESRRIDEEGICGSCFAVGGSRQVEDDFFGVSDEFSGDSRSVAGEDGVEKKTRDVDEVYLAAVETILSVLQSALLSRDCVVGAGVGLCAAAQYRLSSQSLALMFAKAVFPSANFRFARLSEERGLLSEQGQRGMLEAAIHKHGRSSLVAEYECFSEFGKLCLLRGLLTGIPRAALNAHLLRIRLDASGETNEGVSGAQAAAPVGVWTLLYDGILPALCRLCEGTMDSHFKFHTTTAMQICLQQIKASITGRVTSFAGEELLRAALVHRLAVRHYNPLPPSMIQQVLQIVWNNWEDPLTQTVKQVQIVFDLLIDVQSEHLQRKCGRLLTTLGSETAVSEVSGDVGLAIEPTDGDLTGTQQLYRDEEEEDLVKIETERFLLEIGTDLLSVGGHRKGRYVPLASLSLRIGPRKLLEISPNLLFETVLALQDDDVCSSASCFLKSFLERLKGDLWGSKGVTEGNMAFRRLWVPPILSGLVSGNPRLRSNLNTYAFPVALEIDPDCLLHMLGFVLNGLGVGSPDHSGMLTVSLDELEGAVGLPEKLTSEQRIAVLVSILKVARSQALIGGGILQCGRFRETTSCAETEAKHDGYVIAKAASAVFKIRGQPIAVPMGLLESAVTHIDDGMRVDVAELMCLSPKTASMPSPLELRILSIAIPLNMRCSSTGFRMKWISLLKRFFMRIRTSVERQQKLMSDHQKKLAKLSQSRDFATARLRERGSNGESQESIMIDAEDVELTDAVTLQQMEEFMQWVSQLVVSSLYPSAPYERKSMAMEILNALMEVWSLSECAAHGFTSSPLQGSNSFSPYKKGLLSPEITSVVFGSVVDSWDRLREGALKVLIKYPTPLPGLETGSAVQWVLVWVKGLVQSPRVRESDAGALALRLIFRKFVCELGWMVKMYPEPRVIKDEEIEVDTRSKVQRVGRAIGEYLESLNDWLEWGIGEGDKNLIKACEQSFVHGVLLALRYTLDELDFSSAPVLAEALCIRTALNRLLALLLRVTTLALWVVSADALNIQERFALAPLHQLIDEPKVIGYEEAEEMEETNEMGGLAPVEQMLMVGCWLSMKEVSLLLGTLARAVPLPGSTYDDVESTLDRQGAVVLVSSHSDPSSEGSIMLDTNQLEKIGEHFLQVLLSMKHNGAIDKTRAGFTALCDRLLRSNDPRLNAMPELWLEQLIKHTGARGQTVDDLLRRSAGIPAAFLGLFLSEPDGAPKKLLPAAMRWVIGTASDLVKDLMKSKDLSASKEKDQFSLEGSSASDGMESIEKLKYLKSRDEGVVPAVHSFNVMRVAFHDKNLATDTSGFCAHGLIAAIQAFSSRHWEIRNSATLAFTALVHRTIGFLNVYKRESARRAITGFEFFHRYPALHPFLLDELQSATWQLEHGLRSTAGYGGIGVASKLHPSLGPVLIILSRLKPSLINNGAEDWLSPSAFMPYVSRCATQCNQHVRVLASRALAPLVTMENLSTVLLGLAESLPDMLDASLSSGGGSAAAQRPFSYNAVHGILLQIHVLLTSNCAGLPDLEQRGKIISRVADVVHRCQWLGSARLCSCYMVVRAFLQMLEGLLAVSRSSCKVENLIIARLEALLSQLCAECLSEDFVMDVEGFLDSSLVILRERAAKIYVGLGLARWGCVDSMTCGCSGESSSLSTFEMRLAQALSDRMYEVRYAALKVLYKFFHSHRGSGSPTRHWPITRLLQPLLLERLHVDAHPACVRLILQVFFCWSEVFSRSTVSMEAEGHGGYEEQGRDSIWGQGSVVVRLVDRLFRVCETSRRRKTREVAVCCLGACLGQIIVQIRHVPGTELQNSALLGSDTRTKTVGDPGQSRTATRSEHLTQAGLEQGRRAVSPLLSSCATRANIDMFLAVLVKHSEASEGVDFRRATAEAIVASRLLEEAEWVGQCLKFEGKEMEALEWYGGAILSVWSIAIKLLEDEDYELRQKLALSMLQVIWSSTTRVSGPDETCAIASQVERVVQLSFTFLTARFGFWSVYRNHLAQLILGAEDVSDTSPRVDLVRRLFDKELDNHHEEELFFVQLSCLHLKSLLEEDPGDVSCNPSSLVAAQSSDHKKAWIERWRWTFLRHAQDSARLTVQLQASMRWLGGVTNHQDAFRTLYRGLMGLLTVSVSPNGLESLLTEEWVAGLLELTNTLRQMPLNPLISNTLMALLRAYEEVWHSDLGAAELECSLGSALCPNFEPLFLIR